MKGVNTKMNYNQSITECRDKLVNLCNKWEMDDSDKDTMTLEVDDYFMSTIYSVVKLLSKPDMREKVKEYIAELNAEYDRSMNWLEEHINDKPSQVISIEEMRAKTLYEVKCDLESRLEELV